MRITLNESIEVLSMFVLTAQNQNYID